MMKTVSMLHMLAIILVVSSNTRRVHGQERPVECKYPVAGKGKGGKVKPVSLSPSGSRRRTRVRKLAAPDAAFVEQEVEQVYIGGIKPPGLANGNGPKPDGPKQSDPKTDTATAPKKTPPKPGQTSTYIYKAPGKGKGKDPKPPPGMKWYYEPSGSKDPNIEYIICESPSYSPSISTRPSPSPSNVPTHKPSLQPSPSPSFGPTISMNPSTSHQPSVSSMPTSSPSLHKSQWCDSDSNVEMDDGDALVDGVEKYEGSYEYQLITTEGLPDNDMDEILQAIDASLLKALIGQLIWCGDDTGSNTDEPNRERARGRRRFMMEAPENNDIIDAISLGSMDSMNTEKSCSTEFADSGGSGSSCDVYTGNFEIWARTSSNPSEDNTKAKVMKLIQSEMNGDDRNLVEAVDNNDLINVRYGGAESGGVKGIFNGVVEGGDPTATNSGIKAVGALIIAGGAGILLLFLFAASRRKTHHKLTRVEEVIEDDESIFGKGSVGMGTDLMSNGSGTWRNHRGAHVLGEEDSVYSVDFDSDDIVADIKRAERSRLYGMGPRTRLGPQEGNIGGRGDALNVHTCTSATCPICTGSKNPMFVNTKTGECILTPVTEVSLTPREDESLGSRTPSRTRTPLYSETVDRNMDERNYMSPDTVEF